MRRSRGRTPLSLPECGPLVSASEPALRMLLLLLPSAPPAWAHQGLECALCGHISCENLSAAKEAELRHGMPRCHIGGTASEGFILHTRAQGQSNNASGMKSS